MRKVSILAVLLVASFALVVVGCGGDDDDTTTTEATTEGPTGPTGATGEEGAAGETVSMTEYSFEPADFTVSEGESIEVVNDGEIPHNLTVQGDGVATADLGSGESEDVNVDLPPGTYDFICTIGNHAELGMTGTLTVK